MELGFGIIWCSRYEIQRIPLSHSLLHLTFVLGTIVLSGSFSSFQLTCQIATKSIKDKTRSFQLPKLPAVLFNFKDPRWLQLGTQLDANNRSSTIRIKNFDPRKPINRFATFALFDNL